MLIVCPLDGFPFFQPSLVLPDSHSNCDNLKQPLHSTPFIFKNVKVIVNS